MNVCKMNVSMRKDQKMQIHLNEMIEVSKAANTKLGSDVFRVFDRGEYFLCTYMVQFDGMFSVLNEDENALLLEFRGSCFDREGNCIRRTYKKFFNYGQVENTKVVDLSQPHIILDKLDGSMVAPMLVNNKVIHLFKKGELFEETQQFIDENIKYEVFARYMIEMGYTPVYEYVSPSNIIVLIYEEKNMILTGCRNIFTGNLMSYDEMIFHAKKFDIPVVEVLTSEKNFEKLQSYIKNLLGKEGGIIRFDTGEMIKMKADDYLTRHIATFNIMTSPWSLYQIILSDSLDDMANILNPEVYEMAQAFAKKLFTLIEDYAIQLEEKIVSLYLKKYSGKELAVWVYDNFEKMNHSYVFNFVKNNISVKEQILATMKKKITRNKKIEDFRYMLGDLKFNSKWSSDE